MSVSQVSKLSVGGVSSVAPPSIGRGRGQPKPPTAPAVVGGASQPAAAPPTGGGGGGGGDTVPDDGEGVRERADEL